MRFLTLLGMTALLGATACSSDDSDSGSASTDHATFSDGARAQVGSDGSVSLSVDGRTVLSLTGGVRLARYEETSTSLLGMWSFVRDAEETVLVNHFDGGTKSGDSFVAKLARRVQSLRVGPGSDEGVTQGPLIDEAALGKVQAHIDDAVRKGARVVTGGSRHPRGGTFFEPTVLADVSSEMRVAREETFGPVAPVFRFAEESEAVSMANDTEFGLAAYFYSRDVGRCLRVGEALEYGMVGINTGLISNEVAPFGGVKQSGLGREGSRHGLDEYLEIKYLCFSTA